MTDRQADRQTDRQADRQTDRQADRQTDRQTGSKIGRQTERQTNRRTNRQIGERGKESESDKILTVDSISTGNKEEKEMNALSIFRVPILNVGCRATRLNGT